MTRRFWILTILTGLTLCFIWGNSLLPGELSHEFSLLVKKVLKWLKIIKGGGRNTGKLRKIAHFTEYLVLGVELWLLFRGVLARPVFLVLLCGLGTAIIDESIQLLVPGRHGSLKDVALDMGGFLTGCAVCLLVIFLVDYLKTIQKRT